MEKRGISAIVATVMITLITITSVAIIWVGIIPLLKDSVSDLNTEVELSLISEEGYTLWDNENRLAMVQVERANDESDIIGFDIIFELEGNSVTHFVENIPGINQKSVYYVNLTSYEGDLDSIEIIPIFKGGIIGKVASKLKIDKIDKVDIQDLITENKIPENSFVKATGSSGSSGGGSSSSSSDSSEDSEDEELITDEPNSTCNNNIIEAGEICDKNNLSLQNCSSLGFDYGTLLCNSDCLGYDISNCMDNVVIESVFNITQYGITWVFDKEYQTGQFVNGDYWVVPDESGTVNIIDVQPRTAIYSAEDRGSVPDGYLWNSGEYWCISNEVGELGTYNWRNYNTEIEGIYGWYEEDTDRSNREDRDIILNKMDRSFDNNNQENYFGEAYLAQGSSLRAWDTGMYVLSNESLNEENIYTKGNILHGSMINPKLSTQAFDSEEPVFDYDYLLEFPQNFGGNTSILSAESYVEEGYKTDLIDTKISWYHLGKTKTVAVLTVLEDVPRSDSFRPPYVGEDKPIYYANDIDWKMFPKILPPQYIENSSYDFEDLNRNMSAETISDQFSRYINRVWLLHVSGPTGRDIHPPENMPNYHRSVWRLIQKVSMLLTIDLDAIYEDGELEKLAIPFIQLGIDSTYANVDSSFSKLPVMIAGKVFNNNEMINASGMEDRPDWMCYYRNESTSEVVSSIVPADEFYHGYDVGWMQDPGSTEHEHLDPTEWDLVSDGGGSKRESYRGINSPGFVGYSLTLQLFDLVEERNNSALFEYADRWMEAENQSSSSEFIDKMWEEYRGNSCYDRICSGITDCPYDCN